MKNPRKQMFFLRANSFQSSGLSSLETLISIIILSPIWICFSVFAIQNMKTLERYTEASRRIRLEARVRTIFARVMEDIDSHTLPLLPTVHQNGQIYFTDRTPSPLLRVAPLRRPMPGSDALTYLSLNAADEMRITSKRVNSHNIEATACAQTPPRRLAHLRSALMISSELLLEGVVDSRKETKENCSEFLLNYQGGMLGDSIGSDLEDAALRTVDSINPIESIYTIYLDRSGTLRHTQSAGKDILENQPLLDELASIKIEIVQRPDFPKIPEILIRVETKSGQEIKMKLLATIPRRSHENIQLNKF